MRKHANVSRFQICIFYLAVPVACGKLNRHAKSSCGAEKKHERAHPNPKPTPPAAKHPSTNVGVPSMHSRAIRQEADVRRMPVGSPRRDINRISRASLIHVRVSELQGFGQEILVQEDPRARRRDEQQAVPSARSRPETAVYAGEQPPRHLRALPAQSEQVCAAAERVSHLHAPLAARSRPLARSRSQIHVSAARAARAATRRWHGGYRRAGVRGQGL
jgi:hypothetical protein